MRDTVSSVHLRILVPVTMLVLVILELGKSIYWAAIIWVGEWVRR